MLQLCYSLGMAVFRAAVNTEALSGNSEDIAVTNLYVLADSQPDSSELDDWRDAIIDLWNNTKNNFGWLGRSTGPHEIKFYAEDTGVPNYPFATRTFSFSSAGANYDLPAEVQLAFSYANDSENSIPRGRRRGRIYIGGWSESANTTGRPTGTVVSDAADDIETYVDAVNLIPDLTACVYSRTNSAGYAIERVYVDNEWDTLRSRGTISTVRETRTI